MATLNTSIIEEGYRGGVIVPGPSLSYLHSTANRCRLILQALSNAGELGQDADQLSSAVGVVRETVLQYTRALAELGLVAIVPKQGERPRAGVSLNIYYLVEQEEE